MNHTVPFSTETATLALFDPDKLKHRETDPADWWCVNDLSELDEVKQGAISLVNLQSNSAYEIRVTDGELTQDEKDYAANVAKNLGLEITSGKLYIGPGECTPGDGPLHETCIEEGKLIDIPIGNYFVDVYSLFYAATKKFWKPDFSALDMDSAPADFVAIIRPRIDQAFEPLTEEPQVAGIFEQWVFDSDTRTVGPEPGMQFAITARLTKDTNQLVFDQEGPGFYQPILESSTEGINEWDKIAIEVVTVDHEKEEMAVRRVGP